jgi:phosphatidate cytidylyltransferase
LVIASAAIPLAYPLAPHGSPWDRLGLTLGALLVSVALVLVCEMVRFRQPGSSTVHTALALFVVLYVALPIAMLVHLRLWHANQRGLLAVVSVLLIVKVSDAAAYFVGRSLGKRRLTPLLSPKKTVEGALGGLLAGCTASWIFFDVLVGRSLPATSPSADWMSWIAYGASLTLAGMAGDLSESLLKRDIQTKDSSRWLPGLGGVLDVMDSLLWAGPVAYFWWSFDAFGPGG